MNAFSRVFGLKKSLVVCSTLGSVQSFVRPFKEFGRVFGLITRITRLRMGSCSGRDK